jgi:hypothetical protein
MAFSLSELNKAGFDVPAGSIRIIAGGRIRMYEVTIVR